MSDKFMIADKVEELVEKGEVIGRLVTSPDGEQLKVKKGQGGKLTKKWDILDSNIGMAFKFEMATFVPEGKTQSYPYVADFELVKDELKKKALKEVTKTQSDSREHSIEAQVAIKEIGEGWRADKFKGNEPEVIAYRAWILDRLNGFYKSGGSVKIETSGEEKGPRNYDKFKELMDKRRWDLITLRSYCARFEIDTTGNVDEILDQLDEIQIELVMNQLRGNT